MLEGLPSASDPWDFDVLSDGSFVFVANQDSDDVTAVDTTAHAGWLFSDGFDLGDTLEGTDAVP